MVRRALWERKRNRRLLADGGNGGYAGVEREIADSEATEIGGRQSKGGRGGKGEARAAQVAGWRVHVIRQEALARRAVGAARVVGDPLFDAAADLGRAGSAGGEGVAGAEDGLKPGGWNGVKRVRMDVTRRGHEVGRERRARDGG
eukprot:scaffold1410_cov148-Isochrysis_galbana.AAC.5